MNITRLFFSLISPLLNKGLFYRIRFSGRIVRSLGSALAGTLKSSSAKKIQPLSLDEHVVIVGVGIGALSVLDQLKVNSFTNITIIARDGLFGGKCVNFGCMPSEFFLNARSQTYNNRKKETHTFVEMLRALTKARFMSFGYQVLEEDVQEVRGKQLVFANGGTLAFDRLILATGNNFSLGSVRASREGLVRADGFWNIEAKQHLLIVSDAQPAAASYAALALEMGLEVSLCFTRKTPLDHLPSFQYFLRQIQKKGAKIYSNVHEVDYQGTTLIFSASESSVSLKYDRVMYLGSPEISLPVVDNKKPSVFDINFKSSQLSMRPDIYVLGDASGLMSASESELHGIAIGQQLIKGELQDLRGALDKLPIRIHAPYSLAMVGQNWTYLKNSQWLSIDFKNLSCSLIHGYEGQVWYLYNKETDRIEAIHICHPEAGALISQASALMDLPLTDIRWLTSSVHPSFAEIFKLIALNIRKGEVNDTRSQRVTLRMPSSRFLSSDQFFETHYSEQERCQALLSEDPEKFLAELLISKTFSLDLNLIQCNRSQRTKDLLAFTVPGNEVHVQLIN